MGRALATLLVAAACAQIPVHELPPAPSETPYALILGTAQDGGLPQIACQAQACRDARNDPALQRRVASLLIVDPRSGKRWLIDATPDLPEQVELAERVAPRVAQAGRSPLFDGIFLTHAHFGHYTGLAYLGREVYGSQTTEVWGSERMGSFLAGNGPWDLLLDARHIRFHRLEAGKEIELAQDLSISAFPIPHRDEYTDTLGFRVRGPQRSLIYIPDIDKWSVFEGDIEELVLENDFALLDGTFFEEGEIPGRAMSEIPHPFVVESMARFAELAPEERDKVIFTHLNHTNPAADPHGKAAQRVSAAGMHIAREGQILEL